MWSPARISTPSSPDGGAARSLRESSARTFSPVERELLVEPRPGIVPTVVPPLHVRYTHFPQASPCASAPRAGQPTAGALMADEHGSNPFDDDGPTQAAHRAVDWSTTPLGPVTGWPDELRAAIRTVMPSRVPMLIWWGPRMSQLYNDAFTPLIGDKHPRAIGQDAADCYPESWVELGP